MTIGVRDRADRPVSGVKFLQLRRVDLASFLTAKNRCCRPVRSKRSAFRIPFGPKLPTLARFSAKNDPKNDPLFAGPEKEGANSGSFFI